MQKRGLGLSGRLMVNYKNKIEELKQKGIFTKEQAEKLTNSFQKSDSDKIVLKRKFTLETIGVALLLFFLGYIVFAIWGADHAPIVENTANTLNAPIDVGSGSSFIMIVIFLVLVAYLSLYFLAHNRYNAFYRIVERMQVLQESTHNANIMKLELGAKLEALAKEQDNYEKDRKLGIEIKIGGQDSPREYVMRFYGVLEEEIRLCKDQLVLLEAKCAYWKNRFPNTLAQLVGKLPQCK